MKQRDNEREAEKERGQKKGVVGERGREGKESCCKFQIENKARVYNRKEKESWRETDRVTLSIAR